MKENNYLVKDSFYSHPLHKNCLSRQKNSYDASIFHMLLQSQCLDAWSLLCLSTHLYIAISSMTTVKDLAVKGPWNGTRNPFIQFCWVAWSDYNWPEDLAFHCSPWFMYLSNITFFRWASPVLLKNCKKVTLKESSFLYFSAVSSTVNIFTMW